MPEALLPVEDRPVASDPRAYDLLATISALASATPETSLDQAEVLDLLGLADNGFAKEVFARCGVRTRGLEVSSESLERTLQQRTELTEEQLMRLATQAVDGLGADLSEVGVVVTANYYSLGGPTLAHRLVDHYALRPDADKYHIVGVGCASAVPLLRLASQALRDRPAEKALVVAAESTSGFLSPVTADDEKVKIVGSALFGDGAAAALLSLEAAERGHAAGPRIVATAVHQLPGTLDHVRFAVTGEDTHMRMARELPALAETGVPELVHEFLDRHQVDVGMIDHWPLHPGGRGIIEGLQRGLGLSAEDVAPSAAVLSEHGNVGTPSAFLVLQRTIADRAPQPGQLGLAITIGPGVTIGLMLLQW
jgi:predicted naringenin-chalcone synthase